MTTMLIAFGLGFATGGFAPSDRVASLRAVLAGGVLALVAAVLAGTGAGPAAAMSAGAATTLVAVAALAGVMVGRITPRGDGSLVGAAFAVGGLVGVTTVAGGALSMPLPVVDADGTVVQIVAGWSVELRAWSRVVAWRAAPGWCGPLVPLAGVLLVAAMLVPAARRRIRAVVALTAVAAAAVAAGLLRAGVGAPTEVPSDLPPPSGAGAIVGDPTLIGGVAPLGFVVPVGLLAVVAAGLVLVGFGLWSASRETPEKNAASSAGDADVHVAAAAGAAASLVAVLYGVASADPAWWHDRTLGGSLALALLLFGAGWMGLGRGSSRARIAAVVAFAVAIELTRITALA